MLAWGLWYRSFGLPTEMIPVGSTITPISCLSHTATYHLSLMHGNPTGAHWLGNRQVTP